LSSRQTTTSEELGEEGGWKDRAILSQKDKRLMKKETINKGGGKQPYKKKGGMKSKTPL